MKTKTLKYIFSFGSLAIIVGFFVFLCSMYENNSSKKSKYISIEEMIKTNKISAKILSLGGHQENCIELNVQNLTPDTLFFQLEPGRRLMSEDTTMQDIFVVRRNEIALNPNSKINFWAYGFCCESSNHSPQKDAKFNIGKMAPLSWIKLANFINENKFPADAIQSAVWVMSNNHEISSIHNEDIEKIKPLTKFVSELKGIETPWYSVTYKNDTNLLFSNIPEKVYVKFDYYLNKSSIVTINVRNSAGEIIYTLLENMPKNAGKYKFEIKLNVEFWKKGEYQVFVYEDNSKVNLRKTFKL
jgi:hypothetical protein